MSKRFGIVLCLVAGVFVGNAMAQIDPATVSTGHVYLFEEVSGTDVPDDSANTNNGTIVGDPLVVDGLKGKALQFDGVDDGVTIPDSGFINVTNGPWQNRTIIAMFNCADVDKSEKQTVFEEGGRTRGLTIYVFEGEVYVGGWNRAEYNWNGAWISTPIASDEWHAVALVIRDAGDAVEDDKFEMWMDGQLVGTAPGGQMYNHSNNNAIGYTLENNVFHDDDGSGDGFYFEGMIEEVWILNDALTEDEMGFFVGRKSPYAFGPNPGKGVLYGDTWVQLSWKPGGFAVSHDVYLGESFDDVNDGVGDTFQGNVTEPSFLVGMPGAPDGLVPGETYYWRIDEVNDANVASPWKGEVWNFRVQPLIAWDPAPADGTLYVDPDQDLSWNDGMGVIFHRIFFGESYDEVNEADDTIWMAVEASFDPGALDLGKTYYWRVDEFTGPTTNRGDVWNFTTVPEIPIDDPHLIAWYKLDEGTGTTAVDWSGHNNHVALVDATWVPDGWFGESALSLAGYGAIRNLQYDTNDIPEVSACAWIQTSSGGNQYVVSFDRNEYFRLEINGDGAGLGQVGWDVMTDTGQVDYGSVTRVDDGQWHHVCGVYDNGTLTIYIDGEPEPSATGGPVMGTGNVRFGFLGANSEATDFDGSRGTGGPIAGNMDDIRVYDVALSQDQIQAIMRFDPLQAWQVSPGSGATTDVEGVSSLSWQAGEGAAQHDVYFGTDRDAVRNADASDTTGVYQGRQSGRSFTPDLEWGQEYFWRVDEVAGDDTVAKGVIWSFTITDYLIVDTFETYTDDIDAGETVFDTWIDGWTNGTGSQVGYLEAPFAEQSIVNSGGQSMPLTYDNSVAPGISETERTFEAAQDWTRSDVTTLVIHFRGDPANTGQLYLKIDDTRVDYPGDPADIAGTDWIPWEIDLAASGANAGSVKKLTIGIEGGQTGILYVDDIQLKK